MSWSHRPSTTESWSPRPSTCYIHTFQHCHVLVTQAVHDQVLVTEAVYMLYTHNHASRVSPVTATQYTGGPYIRYTSDATVFVKSISADVRVAPARVWSYPFREPDRCFASSLYGLVEYIVKGCLKRENNKPIVLGAIA